MAFKRKRCELCFVDKMIPTQHKLWSYVPPRGLTQWLSCNDVGELVFLNTTSFQLYYGLWLEKMQLVSVSVFNSLNVTQRCSIRSVFVKWHANTELHLLKNSSIRDLHINFVIGDDDQIRCFEETRAPNASIWPSKLTSLSIKGPFLNTPEEIFLPITLMSLDLCKCTMISSKNLVLPPCLQILKFNKNFDHCIPSNYLPSTLTYLSMGSSSFNQCLQKGFFPNSLRSLIFNNKFNKRLMIGALPESLTELKFGSDFNHNLYSGILPESLLHLDLGSHFNKTVAFPPNLINLVLSSNFDQCIYVLPKRLQKLHIGSSFDYYIIEGILPQTLQELTFDADAKFNFALSRITLPKTLTKLVFGKYFGQYRQKDMEIGILPQSLTHLAFGVLFNAKLGVAVLPSQLTYLMFGRRFNQPLPCNVLPASLLELHFVNNSYFDNILIMPLSLERATFGACFGLSGAYEYQFPPSCQILTFHCHTPADVLHNAQKCGVSIILAEDNCDDDEGKSESDNDDDDEDEEEDESEEEEEEDESEEEEEDESENESEEEESADD